MPRLIIAATCAALTLALAACGDDDKSDNPVVAKTGTTDTPAASAAQSGDTVSVGIKDIKFDPKVVTVKVGQKVVWTNDEAVVHNVTATDGADFESDSLNEGDTFDYSPTKAGVIKYVCTIHPGQDGELRVTK